MVRSAVPSLRVLRLLTSRGLLLPALDYSSLFFLYECYFRGFCVFVCSILIFISVSPMARLSSLLVLTFSYDIQVLFFSSSSNFLCCLSICCCNLSRYARSCYTSAVYYAASSIKASPCL